MMSLLLGYDRSLSKYLALFLLVGAVCMSGFARAEELTLDTVQSWLQENGTKLRDDDLKQVASVTSLVYSAKPPHQYVASDIIAPAAAARRVLSEHQEIDGQPNPLYGNPQKTHTNQIPRKVSLTPSKRPYTNQVLVPRKVPLQPSKRPYTKQVPRKV